MSTGSLAFQIPASGVAGAGAAGIVYYTLLTLALIFVFDYLLCWLERKAMARVQLRRGPGLGQNLADFVKLVSKGDAGLASGSGARLLLPATLVILIMLIFLLPIIPASASISADLGMLVLLAALSFIPAIKFVSGFSEGSAPSGLGAQRSYLMFLGYWIPLLMAAGAVAILSGSYSFSGIASAQSGGWFILMTPLGFVVFMIALAAALGRPPFDLESPDGEIASGQTSQTSPAYYSVSYITNYTGLFLGGLLTSILFLGGGNGPLLPPIAWLLAKSLAVALLLVVARAGAIRTRIDRFMRLGFVFLVPLAMINLILTVLIFVK